MGSNSGSPIILDASDLVIGIHTRGACTAIGGSNFGWSFITPELAAAIEDFPGPNTVYVDTVTSSGSGTGSIFAPFLDLQDAADAVANGGKPGQISIVSGSYSGPVTFNTAVTILLPVGPVVIGE
ncbi:MAG: hypothetical protein IH987_08925 [Planctomycetes bacterium]|nr:hypothetical protein [Planctomycetota bacterium]